MRKYILLLCVFLYIQNAFAQEYYEPAYGTVYIMVKNKQKEAVISETIWLENTDSNLRYESITDQKGKAEFRVRRNLTYSIHLTGAGHNDEIFVPNIYQGFLTKTIIYEGEPVTDLNSYDTIRKEINSFDKPGLSTARMELTLVDQDDNPVRGLEVRVRNEKIRKVYVDKTDHSGRVIYMLPVKQYYFVDVESIKGFKEFKLGKYGGLIDKRTFIYVPTEITEWIKQDTVRQLLPENPAPTVLRAYLNILVLDESGLPMPDEPVCLNKLAPDSLVYYGETNSEGHVGFYLPKGFEYVLHFQYDRSIDILDFKEKMTLHQKDIEYTYFPPPPFIAQHYFIPELKYIHFDDYRNYKRKDIKDDFDSDVKIVPSYSHTVLNKEMKELVMSIAWYSKENMDRSNTAPLNICLLVDNSGSMSGEKIAYVKKAMTDYVNKLRDEDRVCLVTFSDEAELLSAAVKISEGKELLLEKIDDIEIIGGTNILEGLKLGYRELEKTFDPDKVNRLILLTDGYGKNDPEEVIALSSSYNEKGLECSAIGIGNDFHQYLLNELAAYGHGIKQEIRDFRDIGDGYYKDLMSVLSPVGRNVRMEIDYPDYLELTDIYEYDYQQLEGETKAVVDLSDIYGKSNQLMLLRFVVHHDKINEKHFPVFIYLYYDDVVSGNQIEIMSYSEVIISHKGDRSFRNFDDELLRKQYIVALISQAMNSMADYYAEGKYNEALEVIDLCMAEVNKILPEVSDQDINRLMDELINYKKTISEVRKSVKK